MKHLRARERCFVSFRQNSAAIIRAGRLNLSSPPRTSIQHHVQPSPKLEVLQDPELLQRSLVHLAPASSLLGLGRHLFGGGALDIAVVGASVAQAGGCLDQPAKRCMEYRGVDRLYNPVPPHQHRVLIKGFLVRFLEAINRTWPAAHRIHNGAADATPADLLAECLFSHIPRRPHLVVLDGQVDHARGCRSHRAGSARRAVAASDCLPQCAGVGAPPRPAQPDAVGSIRAHRLAQDGELPAAPMPALPCLVPLVLRGARPTHVLVAAAPDLA